MGLISLVMRKLFSSFRAFNAPPQRMYERSLLIQAQILAAQNRYKESLGDLGDVEFSAFSQWGEDGILDWLVSQLPMIPHTFIEFGVEDYWESNTRALLLLRNWRGLVMDGSSSNINHIRQQDIFWRHGLTAMCAFIDRYNINSLIQDGGMTDQIGILSIDIDGNDYWIWKAIKVVSPAIVVVEYNAVLGDLHALTVPHRPDFQRTKAHPSNLYFGSSLPALIALGRQRGYSFVGTTSTGCNAFFVRNDLAHRVITSLSGSWAYPSKVREARDKDNKLLFLDGLERSKVIDGLPFVCTLTGETVTLSQYTELYSDAWRSGRKSLL